MFNYASSNLSTDEQSERVEVVRTSSELLSVLGVAPRLGRDFLVEDDVAGTERVALITDGLWRRRFGADPSIVGRTPTLDAAPVRIIGITPPEFSFPRVPEIFRVRALRLCEMSCKGSSTDSSNNTLDRPGTAGSLGQSLSTSSCSA